MTSEILIQDPEPHMKGEVELGYQCNTSLDAPQMNQEIPISRPQLTMDNQNPLDNGEVQDPARITEREIGNSEEIEIPENSAPEYIHETETQTPRSPSTVDSVISLNSRDEYLSSSTSQETQTVEEQAQPSCSNVTASTSQVRVQYSYT